MRLARPITRYTEKETETPTEREKFKAQQLHLNLAFYLAFCHQERMANKGRSGVSEMLWETSLHPMGFRGEGRLLPWPPEPASSPQPAQSQLADFRKQAPSGTSQKDPLNQGSQQAGENTRCAVRASTQCPARLRRWGRCGGGSPEGGWGPLSDGGRHARPAGVGPPPWGSGWETPRCRDDWPP